MSNTHRHWLTVPNNSNIINHFLSLTKKNGVLIFRTNLREKYLYSPFCLWSNIRSPSNFVSMKNCLPAITLEIWKKKNQLKKNKKGVRVCGGWEQRNKKVYFVHYFQCYRLYEIYIKWGLHNFQGIHILMKNKKLYICIYEHLNPHWVP